MSEGVSGVEYFWAGSGKLPTVSPAEFAARYTRWTDWMVDCWLHRRWIYSAEFYSIQEKEDTGKSRRYLDMAYYGK